MVEGARVSISDTQPLTFPFGGLSERFSLAHQPPLTYREGGDVRGKHPLTRRATGGQRSGQSKVGTTALAAAPVNEIASIVQAKKQVTFATIANPNNTSEWSVAVPSQKLGCRDLKCDARGNVYALDGNTAWSLYTPDGKRTLSVSIPLDDRNGIIRTLELSSARQVFVGVAEGGDPRSALIASWVPGLEEDGRLVYDLQWVIKPGRFVTHMRWHDGRLYTTQDDPEFQFSYCVVYDVVEAVNPIEQRIFSVPYPSRALAIDVNGSIFTTHPPFANRGLIPNQNTKNVNRGFDVDDYERNGDIKLWSWFRADKLAEEHLVGEPADLRVSLCADFKPLGIRRHLYGDESLGNSSPHYHKRGPLAGKPAIYFDGIDNALVSLANPGVTAAFADQQLSLLPGYQGAAFAVIMVVTPEPSATMGCLLWQDQENTLAQTNQLAFDRAIIANRPDGAVPGAATKGHISINEDALSGAGGTAPSDIEAAIYDVKTHSGAGGAGLAPASGVLTYVCAGQHAIVAGGGGESSLFRWNGCPIDKWNARPIESAKAGKIGRCDDQTTWNYFKGYVHEIIVLELRDRAAPTTSGLFSDHTTGVAYQYPDTAWSGSSDSIMEQLEAVVARRWGIGHLLDDGATYKRGNEVGDTDSNFVHPYGDGATALRRFQVPWAGSNGPGPGAFNADPNKLLDVDGIVAKWDAQTNALSIVLTDVGGIGYGIATLPKSVFDTSDLIPHVVACCGPPAPGVADVRWLNDNGVALSNAGTASFGTAYDLADQFPRIAVDHFQTLYVPVKSDSTSLGATFAIFRLGSNLLEVLSAATVGASFPAFAIAPAPNAPKYPEAEIAVTALRSEFVYVGLDVTSIDGLSTTTLCLQKVKLVSTTHNTDVPRVPIWLGAAGGNIVRLVEGGPAVTPTGGAGALSSSARFVTAAAGFGKIFWSDGDKYAVYDAETDTVTKFETKKGVLPPRLRVFELWRGRLWAFGDPSNPQIWYASAKDDPFDWDDAPPEDSVIASINGAQADFIGAIAEPINAFIPLTDDFALIGTTTSIHKVVGDPAADGQIDVLSSQYGIAFGRAWTRDPFGRTYVMLTTAEVARVGTDGSFEALSMNIPARLRAIDFETHFVRLQWSQEEGGLYVIVIPFGVHTTQIEHYFWEEEFGAWHPDHYTLGIQPTSVHALEGNTIAERRVVLGCQDGFVRRIDPNRNDDDGNPIKSTVTIGPLAPEGANSQWEYRFGHFTLVLDDVSDGGATLELFGTNEPSRIGQAQTFARLKPGRNATRLERVRGAYCYARLGNAAVGQRWALVSGNYWAHRAGRVRDRSFWG
jgi:hypothetical protein